jgi:hypothetical protein
MVPIALGVADRWAVAAENLLVVGELDREARAAERLN